MDFAAELARYAQLLETKGLVTGLAGNVSMIDRETGLTYVTPSRRMKLLLTPEMVCVMAPDGSQIGGSCRRSSEYLLHEAVYKARPDVRAIIHSHCPYLTAYAVRYHDFVVPENCSMHEVFQRFVCLPWGQGGTHDIHRGIEEALKNSPICLLGGHGAVCVSSSMEDCVGLLESAEDLAQTIFLAQHMR